MEEIRKKIKCLPEKFWIDWGLCIDLQTCGLDGQGTLSFELSLRIF